MTPVVRVLAALADHGVRPSGAGWIARCPAHDDRRASLCIGQGRDGRVLLCCHGGCEVVEVVRALGLAMRDLFAVPACANDGRTYYDYRDEVRRLLFQVVRIPVVGGKEFRQRRPDGSGKWIWNVQGVRPVLYRLPELLAANPSEFVFIVEGEKDADNLASWGFVATTNPGGARKWRREYTQVLRGRQVVVIPDNDDPGRLHGAQVSLRLARVATSVKVLELSGLPHGGDVSDWIEAGGTSAELLRLASVAAPVGNGPLGAQPKRRGST